jgi:pyruvate dehydrogenase complex dehydrogenase (E1) component
MKGMEGEQRCDKRALPQRTGHSYKNQQQQKRVSHMKQQTGKVMTLGIQTIELAVDHMGDPCKWMPVAGE